MDLVRFYLFLMNVCWLSGILLKDTDNGVQTQTLMACGQDNLTPDYSGPSDGSSVDRDEGTEDMGTS